MPKGPESGSPNVTAAIGVTDTRAPDVEPTLLEFEPENIPDTAEKVGDFILRRLAEYEGMRAVDDEEISEEAVFIRTLQQTLWEFAKNQPEGSDIGRRMPTLYTLAGVLRGENIPLELTPDEVRLLEKAIAERFGVPERHDVTMQVDGEAVKGQAGRKAAHEKFMEGLTNSWKKLLIASWKHTYAEQFPVLIGNRIHDIANADSLPEQRKLIETLTRSVQKLSRTQFHQFLRALINEGVYIAEERTDSDPSQKKKGLITMDELASFAGFVATRLPPGADITADEIISLMRDAATKKGGEGNLEGGTLVPPHKLRLIIEGFARNIHDVYELAAPEFLFERDSIPATVLYAWHTFSNPQRLQFIELIRATYTGEPYASENDERKKLLRFCTDLAKKLRTGKEVKPTEVEQLALSLSTRVMEVIDFATSPDIESAGEEARPEDVEDTEIISPAVRLAEVRQKLGEKQAYIPGILRTLRRNDMTEGRLKIFSVILSRVIEADKGGPLTSLQISTIQSRAGVTLNESDISAIQTVIDTAGASTNKVGWGLLLRAGNRDEGFRDAMGHN